MWVDFALWVWALQFSTTHLEKTSVELVCSISVHALLGFLMGWNCLPWLSVVIWNVSMYPLSGASHKLAPHEQHSSAVPLAHTSTQFPRMSLYTKSFTRPSRVTCLGRKVWAQGYLSMGNFSSWQTLYFRPTYSSWESVLGECKFLRAIIKFVTHMLIATEDTVVHIP